MSRHAAACASLILIVTAASGCARSVATRDNTTIATAVDPATTQPAYWYQKPATAQIAHANYARLWDAAEDVARGFGFYIDRTDLRSGVLTTRPLTSAQFFEPWRRDVRTVQDSAESSLATIRRTIRFEFRRTETGDFAVTPKVLVERQAFAEQRMTSAISYRQVFARPIRPENRQRGTSESDVGIYLPQRYWYPIDRDHDLEQAVVRAIAKKLKPSRAVARRATGS